MVANARSRTSATRAASGPAAVHPAATALALLRHVSDIISVVDAHGQIRYESPSVERVLGYRADDLIGSNALEWIHPEDIDEVSRLFKRALTTPGPTTPIEFRIRHRDGSWRCLEALANNRGDDPAIGGVVVTARDVTERKRLEHELVYEALHDPLTGLPNRALFLDRLHQALLADDRQDGSTAVLFLDLDHFKVVNDSLGHAAGDDLLRAVALRLRESVRASDTIARFGGDEFALLLEQIGAVNDARSIADRALIALAAPFVVAGREVHVSASIGIAVAHELPGVVTPDDLLRCADIAMYQAKAAGKDCAVVFDATMNAAAIDRLDLEADLRQALRAGELTVWYQPEMQLRGGAIVGLEALVRWQHPRLGLLPPARFIPVAEESGLILDLGEWVLRTASQQAAAWQGRGPAHPLLVSVNLSPRELRCPGLVSAVKEILAVAGVDPTVMRLEITETAAMHDLDTTAGTLLALKGMGTRLAIDDFGTGYSSLSYLTQLVVDTIKIDRSFVLGIDQDPRNEAVVKAVIALAHALDMDVTAEGIETSQQLQRLRALGCDAGQGYYFARPLTSEAVWELIASRTI